MVLVNNRDKVDYRAGMTVQDLLNRMGYSYKLITVTVNENLVLEEDYTTFKLNDHDNVGVFHLAHGG